MKRQSYTKGEADRVLVGGKVKPAVRAAIEGLAHEEERSVSNMLARLLEESPRIKARLKKNQPEEVTV